VAKELERMVVEGVLIPSVCARIDQGLLHAQPVTTKFLDPPTRWLSKLLLEFSAQRFAQSERLVEVGSIEDLVLLAQAAAPGIDQPNANPLRLAR
jgi:hypothetical protein